MKIISIDDNKTNFMKYLTYKNTSGVYSFVWKNLNLNPDSGYSIFPSYFLLYADNDIYVLSSTTNDFIYIANNNFSTYDKVSNVYTTVISASNAICADPIFYDCNFRDLNNVDYNYQIEYYLYYQFFLV